MPLAGFWRRPAATPDTIPCLTFAAMLTPKLSLLLAAGAALLLAPLTSAQADPRRRGGPAIRGYDGRLSGGHRANFSGHHHHRGGGHRYGGHRGYHGGRRYYHRGSSFYYDPFLYGGFGYPAYYGGFGPGFGVGYSSGYGYGYGDGYYGEGDRVYQGRIASGVNGRRRNADNGRRVEEDDEEAGNGNGDGRYSPDAMARAVQTELKERGYYRGTVDGQFGEGSAGALREFQRDKGLRVTGRLDERTLRALGIERR